MRRVRHAFLIIIGRTSRSALLTMEIAMALEKTTADIATINTLAAAVVAELQTAQTAASSAQAVAEQAQADLTGADDTLSTQLQQIITILQAVALPVQLPTA